jgi:hypothetical protein
MVEEKDVAVVMANMGKHFPNSANCGNVEIAWSLKAWS